MDLPLNLQDYTTLENYLFNICQMISVNYSIIDIRKVEYLLSNDNYQAFFNILSGDDWKEFYQFRMLKRKSEWLSGRLAAKIALFSHKAKENITVDFRDIKILKNKNKAPYFSNCNDLYLSITHSHPYAIAVVSKNKIGIDIEKLISSTSIFSLFFSDIEIKELYKHDNTLSLKLATMAWTQKEAISKYRGLGMKLNFREIKTSLTPALFRQQKIEMYTSQISNFYVSIATRSN